jgi:hypothetical protein
VEEISISVQMRRLHAELEIAAVGNVELQVYGVLQTDGFLSNKRGHCAEGNKSAMY